MSDSIDDPTCIFCRIKNREIAAAWVYEGDDALAFLDHNPLFDGHVLVVPPNHHQTLFDVSPEEVAGLFKAVQRIGAAVKIALDSDGIFVASNNGVSQSVDHLHVHVVPRRKKDGLRGFMWPRHKYENDAAAAEIAARIAASLPKTR
jgi:histidine triad (HIT) family protein